MMRFGGPGMMLEGETSKPASVVAALSRVWHQFARYKLVLLVVAVLVVATTYVQVLVPDLLGQAVDCYVTPAAQKAFGGGGNIAGSPPAASQAPVSSNCWYAHVPPTATTNDLIAGLGGLVLLTVGLFFASS